MGESANSSLKIISIFFYVATLVITLIGVGLVLAGLMSSGWQLMIEIGGTNEIHQHGLWMDYILRHAHREGAPAPMSPRYENGYSGQDMAGLGGGLGGMGGGMNGYNYNGYGMNGYNGYDMSGMNADGESWIMTYKFGDAVIGDDVHRAQGYQIYMLILGASAVILALMGSIISYCISWRLHVSIGWVICLCLASVLGGSGLIQFFINCMLPEYRFVYTDRRIEQIVGYAFYRAAAGVGLFFVASILSIVCVAMMYLQRRRENNTGIRTLSLVRERGY